MALIRLLLPLLLASACAGAGPLPAQPPVRAGGVELRASLPPGSEVAVTGSFNGWALPGHPLRESRPGRYETFLDLEPGTHRLQLVIRTAEGSERWVPPPGLGRYEPDGFGGSNAVVEVPRNLTARRSSERGK